MKIILANVNFGTDIDTIVSVFNYIYIKINT